jgi:hypothetical protein
VKVLDEAFFDQSAEDVAHDLSGEAFGRKRIPEDVQSLA